MRATFSTSSLAVGNHFITAVYTGDASFRGSTRVFGQTVKSMSAALAPLPSASFSLASRLPADASALPRLSTSTIDRFFVAFQRGAMSNYSQHLGRRLLRTRWEEVDTPWT
jgi:hypothetical protein